MGSILCFLLYYEIEVLDVIIFGREGFEKRNEILFW